MTRVRIMVDANGEPYDEPVDWSPGDPPPPWKPPTRKADFRKYRMAMIDFVEWNVFDQFTSPPPKYPAEWLEPLASALYDARRGDIEPLRKALPQLSEFLHLPTQTAKRGYDVATRAREAADAVAEVRALWKKTYRKTTRRFKPSAEEIVANIFNVDVKDVELCLSRDKAGRHREKVSS